LATIHQRYRQDRETDRQRSDSIRRTVLQTVVQNATNSQLLLPLSALWRP